MLTWALATSAQGVGADNYADMGNPDDEVYHNLRGWRTINQALLPVQIDSDRTSRYMDQNEPSSVDLFIRHTKVPYTLTFRTEDGACDDSFEVSVNDSAVLYRYAGHRSSSVTYPVHQVQVDGSLLPSKRVKIIFRNLAVDQCGLSAVYFARLDPAGSPAYRLDVAVTSGGSVASAPSGVTCGIDCTEGYVQDQLVTLAATAAAGYVFAGWRGDPECSDGQLTMSEDWYCEAHFVIVQSAAATRGIVDLNGDAGADIFRYNTTTGSWAMELGDRNGLFGTVKSAWGTGWSVRAGDFNGDGLTDMFLYSSSTGQWFKCISTGGGDFTYSTSNWAGGWTPYVLDLDGDGKSDVFIYNLSTGAWFKCSSVGSGTEEFVYEQGTWDGGWELYPADFNGDGRSDLFLYNPTSGTWVRAVSESAGFSYQSGRWSPGWGIHPGDFDGDGRSDVFLYDSTTGRWFIATTDGTSFTYVTDAWSPGWVSIVTDLDANGHADLFLYNPRTGVWVEAINGGNGTFTYASGTWSIGWEVYGTDFNTDRKSDLLLYNPTSTVWVQVLNAGVALFTYTSGVWEQGLTIVANTTRVP